jgi:hypothetical protein
MPLGHPDERLVRGQLCVGLEFWIRELGGSCASKRARNVRWQRLGDGPIKEPIPVGNVRDDVPALILGRRRPDRDNGSTEPVDQNGLKVALGPCSGWWSSSPKFEGGSGEDECKPDLGGTVEHPQPKVPVCRAHVSRECRPHAGGQLTSADHASELWQQDRVVGWPHGCIAMAISSRLRAPAEKRCSSSAPRLEKTLGASAATRSLVSMPSQRGSQPCADQSTSESSRPSGGDGLLACARQNACSCGVGRPTRTGRSGAEEEPAVIAA